MYISKFKEEIPEKYFTRFWRNVRKTKGCWYWTGYKNRAGYGRIRILDKIFMAHRFSYLIYNGELPDDMLVMHTCDNPACVNPKHLMIGTIDDNVKDSKFKKRTCRGSAKWCAKVNEIQVKYIRQHREIMADEIAKMFNITKATVYRIRNYKIWKHVI